MSEVHPSYRIWRFAARTRRRIRGARFRLTLRVWGASVGGGLEVEKGVWLRHPPHGGLAIGRDVYLGRGLIIDAPPGARFVVGDRVKLMHNVLIAAASHVSIGRDTQLAEGTSIHDSDHALDRSAPIRDQRLRADPVRIGADVWVGRGCAILRGSELGDGCVVGANSVVKTTLEPGSIAVGVPARVVGSRPTGAV